MDGGDQSQSPVLLHAIRWGRLLALVLAVVFVAIFGESGSLAFLALAVGMLGGVFPTLLVSQRLYDRGRPKAALVAISCVLWLIALGTASRGALALAPAALILLVPAVVAIPYLSGRELFRHVSASISVCAVCAVLAALGSNAPSALSDPNLAYLAAAIVPLVTALFLLVVWSVASRDRGMVQELYRTTLALADSERSLESKVEDRTQQLARKVAEISDINEVARTVNATLELDVVMGRIRDGLRKVFDFDRMDLFLRDDTGETLRLDRQLGVDPDPELAAQLREAGISMAEADSVLVEAVRDGSTRCISELTPQLLAGLTPADQLVCALHPPKALLLCPLEIRGEVIGCMLFGNSQDFFELSGAHIGSIRRYVTPIATAIQNARLFEEAERARESAVEANRAKSAFLASVSHELRTPLAAIIGYTELLQEDAEDEGQAGILPDLDKIHTASKHLLELINGVLDLAKIEAGKLELYVEELDVAELLRGVLPTVKPLLKKNENQLETSGLDTLGAMRSDATKLRQVLFNLLSNAAKFTEKGSIRLEATREDDWLSFVVSDTGIGMREDQLARVFDEFAQADATTSKTYGGTGLGLPISRKLCRLLGGTLEASSEPGRGSRFEVRLPAHAPERSTG
jgi:signal transduction histidine kinase